MKVKIVTASVLAMVTISSARAATTEELARSLYTKMADIVMPGGNRLEIGKSYFVIANPGIVIGSPSDFGGDTALEQLISQVDMVPMQSPFYEPGLFHLTQLYTRTIDEMSVPQPPNKAELEAQYDALRARETGDLEAPLKQFQDLQDALDTVEGEIDEYKRAQAEARNVDITSISETTAMKNKRKVARRNLDNFTGTVKLASHLAKVTSLATSLPDVFKRRLRITYDAKNTGQEFPAYVFYPPVNKWDGIKWTTYSFNESDLKSVSVDEFKSSGGRAGLDGIFGGVIGGSAANSEQWNWSDIEGTDLDVKFDLGRVGIYRPWFDPGILTSKRWRLDDGELACNVWSDGNVSEENDKDGRENELMPFYIKSLILAKNLKLHGKWNKDFKSEYTKNESMGGRVRFGFFSAGASKTHTYTKKESRSQLSDTGIENADIQIIGFIVQPLPLTPNPADISGYTWEKTLPVCD